MTSFPTMTLKEEFESDLQDALYGTALCPDDLLAYYCETHLGIAYCEENEEEMMEAVVEEPFILNRYADQLENF